MREVRGAYVQAWVWVDADTPTDSVEHLREKAKRLKHEEGTLEIDDHASVSMSYEGE